MTAPAHRYSAAASSVGIGWRHPHYAALLEQQPALDFVEVHSENFFAPGGAALAVLREGRAHYAVSLHGVGLSLGSAAGIDPWHLDQLARLVDVIDPVRVSDHASFARGPGAHANDLLPVPLTHAALDAMCANVNRVQDRLAAPSRSKTSRPMCSGAMPIWTNRPSSTRWRSAPVASCWSTSTTFS